MRHFPVVVCSLGLLSAALGCCNHYAGVCDCEKDPRGCERYALCQPTVAAQPGAGVLAPVPAASIDAPKPIPIPPR